MGRLRLAARRSPERERDSAPTLQAKPRAKRRSPQSSAAAPDIQTQLRSATLGHSFGAMPLQANLAIGQPNDQYEQEADAIAASAVQRQPAESSEPDAPATIQRQDLPAEPDLGGEIAAPESVPTEVGGATVPDEIAPEAELPAPEQAAEGLGATEPGLEGAPPPGELAGEGGDALGDAGFEEFPVPEPVKEQIAAGDTDGEAAAEGGGVEASIQRALASGGEDLPEDDQAKLRDRLGILNPEAIRLHDDDEAHELCEMLAARAFTTGCHIFFGAGEYGDDELLFHEAVHAIQQGAVEASDPDANEDAGEPQDDPTENAITPDEEQESLLEAAGSGGLMMQAAPVPADTIQRAKQDEDEGEAANADEQPTEAEQQADADQQAADTEAAGEGQKEDAAGTLNDAAGEIGEEGEVPTGESVGDAQADEAGGSEGGVGEPEAEEEGLLDDLDDEVLEEVEVEEFAEPELFAGTTLQDEVSGFDEALGGYEAFQETLNYSADDNLFWENFIRDNAGLGELSESFDQDVELDRGALIGEALLAGALEGAISATLAIGAEFLMEKFASKFPVAGAGIGSVMAVASVAADPEGWFEDNILVFGKHAETIAGIAQLGEAGTFWEGAAIFTEFLIGIVSMVKQVVSLIDTILQLLVALLWIFAAISYGIGTGLASGGLTAPLAPPFFAAATALWSWAGSLQSFGKFFSFIGLLLTIILLPLQALAMGFRIADIATYEGDPKELLAKQDKLRKHTAKLVSGSADVANKARKGDVAKLKAGLGLDKPTPADNMTEAELADFGDRQNKWKEDRNEMWKKPFEPFTAKDSRVNNNKPPWENKATAKLGGKGGKLFGKTVSKLIFKGSRTWFENETTPIEDDQPAGDHDMSWSPTPESTQLAFKSDDPDAEQAWGGLSLQDALTGSTNDERSAAIEEDAYREAIIPLVAERVHQGAEDLPEPPMEAVNEINAGAIASQELAARAVEIEQDREFNAALCQEAKATAAGNEMLIQTTQLNLNEIERFQGQLDEKQGKQAVAMGQLAAVEGQAGETAKESTQIDGMIATSEPQIEENMQKGESQGAEGDAADPEAIQDSGVTDGLGDAGQAAAAGQTEMQKNQQATQQASGEADSDAEQLQTLQEEQQEDKAACEEAVEESEVVDEELDAAAEENEVAAEEAAAAREAAIAEVQAWVDDYNTAEQVIYDDVETIIQLVLATPYDQLFSDEDTVIDAIEAELAAADAGDDDSNPAPDPTPDESELESLVESLFADGFLANEDFSQLDLSNGAELDEAILTEVDFSEANLTGASLVGADLSEADLSGADLTEADLSEADLSEADLSEAILEDAILTDADLSNADLTAADLTGAIADGAKLPAGVSI